MSLRRDRIKRYLISTIALNRDDPQYGYETMVFNRYTARGKATMGNQQYCRHYQTEEEAIKGHEDVVKKIKEGWTP